MNKKSQYFRYQSSIETCFLIVVLLACISCDMMAQQAYLLNERPMFIQDEERLIRDRLKSNQPIRLLLPSDRKALKAEELVVSSVNLKPMIKNIDGSVMRLEVFGVYKALPSDKTSEIAPKCPDGSCYKVELYNFTNNLSISAIVNIASNQVLTINSVKSTQPDIPAHLKELAIRISTESPAVQAALGYKPNSSEAQMAGTKTSLNKSRCERSLHLCVAPTIVQGSKALWTIVDLTDMKLVGIRWTNVGQSEARPGLTERKLQNEVITSCFCEKENTINRDQWELKYQLTSSDGLKISEVKFKAKPILDQAKLVDWHVSYSNTDGFGYSDAIGCPLFSTAAVVAVDPPQVMDLIKGGKKLGFVLEQSFFSEGWPAACNYNYVQRYEFYDDGKFRISAASVGRGCGNNGTYRPVFRIAFAGVNHDFLEMKEEGWKTWEKENWAEQNDFTKYSKEGFQYKIHTNKGDNYGIEPGKGQFEDGGRGDNAFLYVSVDHPELDEGLTDLVTIGPCCNTDFQQGPERFIQSESLMNEKLVIWYSAMMKNDDRPGQEYCWAKGFVEDGIFKTLIYPCFVGPMFIPIP